MIITTPAILINSIESSYSFEGKSGISRKARFLIENEIFEVRFNESQIELFNSLPPKNTKLPEAVFELNSPKEKLQFSLISLQKNK